MHSAQLLIPGQRVQVNLPRMRRKPVLRKLKPAQRRPQLQGQPQRMIQKRKHLPEQPPLRKDQNRYIMNQETEKHNPLEQFQILDMMVITRVKADQHPVVLHVKLQIQVNRVRDRLLPMSEETRNLKEGLAEQLQVIAIPTIEVLELQTVKPDRGIPVSHEKLMIREAENTHREPEKYIPREDAPTLHQIEHVLQEQ
jgi:hypothetical protein